MTDKELLELAAKAAKINIQWMGAAPVELRDGLITSWNPLKDDGDALRLAVKCEISITPYPIYESPKHSVIAKQYRNPAMREVNPTEKLELYEHGPCAATRRAIVRAAAEIGKAM